MDSWKGLDLTGRIFGRLIVICRFSSRRQKRTWLCQCQCGNHIVRHTNALTSGDCRSCGCLKQDYLDGKMSSRLHKHRATGTPEYRIWSAMLTRTRNPRQSHYHRYGGRGIKVCERWLDFQNFLDDMGPRPSPRHSIDRVNNDGDYEPGNCRWATPLEQRLNSSRKVIYLTFQGKTQTIAEWAEETGIPVNCLRQRYGRLKWSAEKTLTEKIREGGRRKKVQKAVQPTLNEDVNQQSQDVP